MNDSYTLNDLIPLLVNADGYARWEGWIADNRQLSLSAVLDNACDAGRRWGLNALGLEMVNDTYDAAINAITDDYIADFYTCRDDYRAAVKNAGDALISAVAARIEGVV